ncbi:HU family DNA-binding protein [Bacteroides finegoldii]|jgi:putative integration host factor IHF alpha subunit (fragment)|uniref:HU family DNA-binding protein n=1 Tax=Bacteroides finegoldii TaxID=338188 RepID=A0A174FBN4_9BACE|nr:HU family DNA-binding protein [Bacteroides finegoldii]KAA5213522.1 HU family DNA-binding protein [Bacteroides finegoldii]KAA5217632.1 HU family DNA-binding protein [Bacteroides finegoldii]KAA5222748.1 HU family DNA-binding protein [Bacteroides finegoldii]KAA5226718.1 HU family DNA-binding protein [Bacteroides finegoldii]KAA5231337.1 HU family DNA-binding protein [Bacteroides finegoldii]
MNERLTIQDLTDLLAAKHSMTKKDAEAFVKEFFLLIEQALESENTVKIKGLGTFKLIDVDSRESVNVNTGERFQIKGHTKVSFSPDANLRDTINKPFAHFETVVLNENTVLEDTPIEETEEEESGEEVIPTDIPESIEPQSQPKEEEKEEMSLTEIQPIVEPRSIEPQSVVVEPKTVPVEKKEIITAEEIIEQELLRANLKPESTIVRSQEGKSEMAKGAEVAQTAIQPTPQKNIPDSSVKEKSPVPYLITIIILVLLLCGGVVLFIYYPDLFSSSSDKNALDMPPVTTQPVKPEVQLSDTIEQDSVKDIKPETPKTSITPTPVVPQKKEAVTPAKTENKVIRQQPSTSVYLDSASYKITGTKTKYTVKEGETLTRVSLRFYGTKAMWPYIVKHNPDVIKNPNNVPYGTTIKIPELTKE